MKTVKQKQGTGGGITLPPMPESLQQLRREQAKSEPDAQHISDIIAADVSLSAEVLKAINSPLFARNRAISSVHTAVMLLGVANVLNITSGIALRHSLNCGDNRVRLDRFWDTASDVAYAAASYAREYSGIPADMAYALGLFHDCAIPLMMCRFSDYIDTLQRIEKDADGDLLALENERYGANHAQLGEMIARSWKLPKPLCEAIGYHHRFEEMVARNEQVDEVVVSLVALLKMAEHTSREFRGLAFRDDVTDPEWQRISTLVLSHFDLDADEFHDMMERVLLELGQR